MSESDKVALTVMPSLAKAMSALEAKGGGGDAIAKLDRWETDDRKVVSILIGSLLAALHQELHHKRFNAQEAYDYLKQRYKCASYFMIEPQHAQLLQLGSSEPAESVEIFKGRIANIMCRKPARQQQQQ